MGELVRERLCAARFLPQSSLLHADTDGKKGTGRTARKDCGLAAPADVPLVKTSRPPEIPRQGPARLSLFGRS